MAKVVRFGESVALRWGVAGATEVYLEYQGQRYGKTAPREELFSPAEDTTYAWWPSTGRGSGASH